MDGLKCFQRDEFTPVPGCAGHGKKDWDYCYDPTGSTELSGGNDNDATGLEACIGECDNDGQCKDGLKCFQRDDGETIPGCTGPGAGKDWDYCYDPSWTPGTTTPAAEPAPAGGPVELGGTNDGDATNLEACIGECDSDAQCKPGLKCFQRTGLGPVPGCAGQGKKDWDYCYDPTGSVELSGGNDNGATGLEACIGECDNDGQCKDGLKCFQRDDGETIPGCTGPGAGKDWDYCYDPSWTPGTTTPAAEPAPAGGPVELGGTNDGDATNLEACIGECDSDAQCKPGLKCFQRTGLGPVPGCAGQGKKDWDYC